MLKSYLLYICINLCITYYILTLSLNFTIKIHTNFSTYFYQIKISHKIMFVFTFGIKCVPFSVNINTVK